MTFQAKFYLEIEPTDWTIEIEPNKILFQTCDNIDELILVVRFIIKHNVKAKGKLVATFFK